MLDYDLHLEKIVCELVEAKLEKDIEEYLDWNFEEKINTLIDETVSNYDFSDWLDDWIDSYLHEKLDYKLDDLISSKVEEYINCISPEDFGVNIHDD